MPKGSREQEFNQDMARLKDPENFKEKYKDEEARGLAQAVELVARARQEAFGDPNSVGYKILVDTGLQLENALKDRLTGRDEQRPDDKVEIG